ncbi:hypothetical protein CEE44_03260 [Candidatus Woesearchaeota archaeon B3_Woes]|nr:MAG: hypothetical protein CEE44_03260 [Candidatus Woesearchaeota archaeon B3_Woes]
MKMGNYQKHLKMMKEGCYSQFLKEEAEKRSRINTGITSPLRGVGRIAEVRATEDLINLNLIGSDRYKGIEFKDPFFEYDEGRGIIGFRIPAFFYLNSEPSVVVILDEIVRYSGSKLRQEVLMEIVGRKEINKNLPLYIKEINLNNSGWAVEDFIALEFEIYHKDGDFSSFRKEDALSLNERGIRDLVNATYEYLELTIGGKVESAEERALEELARKLVE